MEFQSVLRENQERQRRARMLNHIAGKEVFRVFSEDELRVFVLERIGHATSCASIKDPEIFRLPPLDESVVSEVYAQRDEQVREREEEIARSHPVQSQWQERTLLIKEVEELKERVALLCERSSSELLRSREGTQLHTKLKARTGGRPLYDVSELRGWVTNTKKLYEEAESLILAATQRDEVQFADQHELLAGSCKNADEVEEVVAFARSLINCAGGDTELALVNLWDEINDQYLCDRKRDAILCRFPGLNEIASGRRYLKLTSERDVLRYLGGAEKLLATINGEVSVGM